MTDQVNFTGQQGDFLTGQMDTFTIATIVPVLQTNVSTPIVDLPGYQTLATTGVWSNVSVIDGNGVTQNYTTEQAYLNAFYQQENLNQLISTFELRALPVAVTVANVATGGSTNSSNTSVVTSFFGNFANISALTTHFGSATTATTVNIVQFLTERTQLWNVDTTTVDSNTNGYQFLGTNGLQGTVAYDVYPNVLPNSVATVQADGTTAYVSAFDSTSSANYNTTALVKIVTPYYK